MKKNCETSPNYLLSRLLTGQMAVKKKTVVELARDLGLSRQTVSKYLLEPSVAPLGVVLKACSELDIPVEDLRNALTYYPPIKN